jgi:hypothetical protein
MLLDFGSSGYIEFEISDLAVAGTTSRSQVKSGRNWNWKWIWCKPCQYTGILLAILTAGSIITVR